MHRKKLHDSGLVRFSIKRSKVLTHRIVRCGCVKSYDFFLMSRLTTTTILVLTLTSLSRLEVIRVPRTRQIAKVTRETKLVRIKIYPQDGEDPRTSLICLNVPQDSQMRSHRLLAQALISRTGGIEAEQVSLQAKYDGLRGFQTDWVLYFPSSRYSSLGVDSAE